MAPLWPPLIDIYDGPLICLFLFLFTDLFSKSGLDLIFGNPFVKDANNSVHEFNLSMGCKVLHRLNRPASSEETSIIFGSYTYRHSQSMPQKIKWGLFFYLR